VCVVQIKAADLENALLVLPFHYLGRFVNMLLEVCERNMIWVVPLVEYL
jgi:hypothetical protein